MTDFRNSPYSSEFLEVDQKINKLEKSLSRTKKLLAGLGLLMGVASIVSTVRFNELSAAAWPEPEPPEIVDRYTAEERHNLTIEQDRILCSNVCEIMTPSDGVFTSNCNWLDHGVRHCICGCGARDDASWNVYERWENR